VIFENLVFGDFAHSGTPICGQTASWIQKLDSEVENNPRVSSNFSRKPAFLRGGVWNFPNQQHVKRTEGTVYPPLRTADISKIHIKSAKMVTKNLSPEMKRSRSKESQKNGEKNLKPPESFQIFIFVFSGFQNN
jgi:hypothetical protein